MNLPRLVPATIASLLLLASQLYAVSQASCVFETFQAPTGFTFSQVNGISDDGTVVGQMVKSDTQEFIGFARSGGGVITEYAVPKALTTWLYGRNGIGAETGFYQDTAYPQHVHGFVRHAGDLTAVNYPKAANTWLFAANLTGESVGSYSVSPALIKAFKLANGKYTTIAFAGAQSTYAIAVNDKGKVVGTYSNSPVSNGFTWENGSFTTVNFPNAKYGTILSGINNSGVIVGNHLTADEDYGFIYENGTFKNIVYPGAKFTMAGGINNNGMISGMIFFAGPRYLGYTAMCK